MALQPRADQSWLRLRGFACEPTGWLCPQTCEHIVRKSARQQKETPRDGGARKRRRGHGDPEPGPTPSNTSTTAAPAAYTPPRVHEASLLRWQAPHPINTREVETAMDQIERLLPAAWHDVARHILQTVIRPGDSTLRACVWDELAHLPSPRPLLTWYEVVRGMGPGDDGPPMLTSGRLLPCEVERGDDYGAARAHLLRCSTGNVLHEIKLMGVALDPLDLHGRIIGDTRPLSIDECVTRYRAPLVDVDETGKCVKLFQRFGWADPNQREHCALLLHPEHVPLLVTEENEHHKERGERGSGNGCGSSGESSGESGGESDDDGDDETNEGGCKKSPGRAPRPAPIGRNGMAPVLMYLPRLDLLLAPGHLGRVALESLLPAEGASWLESILPLPPDHSLNGSTLAQVLTRLATDGSMGKAYGHGHAFERLTYTGTMGDSASATWVPSQVNKKQGAREQRPLIGGTILEWNQASSALHYGLVNACVPAAEALLQMLLPAWHPSRKYKTVLAPYGEVWSYAAQKWYVSKLAAERFPGLVKHTARGVSSYDESRGGAARAIANHFDTRNTIFWGLCIIFGARRAHMSFLLSSPG